MRYIDGINYAYFCKVRINFFVFMSCFDNRLRKYHALLLNLGVYIMQKRKKEITMKLNVNKFFSYNEGTN